MLMSWYCPTCKEPHRVETWGKQPRCNNCKIAFDWCDENE